MKIFSALLAYSFYSWGLKKNALFIASLINCIAS